MPNKTRIYGYCAGYWFDSGTLPTFAIRLYRPEIYMILRAREDARGTRFFNLYLCFRKMRDEKRTSLWSDDIRKGLLCRTNVSLEETRQCFYWRILGWFISSITYVSRTNCGNTCCFNTSTLNASSFSHTPSSPFLRRIYQNCTLITHVIEALQKCSSLVSI